MSARASRRTSEESAVAGRVLVRHGARLAIEDEAGEIRPGVSRRQLGALVCGDRVRWTPTSNGEGVVVALEPRHGLLSRPDYSGRDKPLAANLSLLLIVIAPEPAPSRYLIDQYLVTAERMGIEALILLNKADLLSTHMADSAGCEKAVSPDMDVVANLAPMDLALGDYREIGYDLLAVSADSGQGLHELRERLSGETAILLGQSGVGKSSLTQALLPDQQVQIGRLSAVTGLGRHTTSAATCYRLPTGGYLIDSPGVRSFRLGAMSRDALAQGFREFRPHLGRCQFANCRHERDPGCALNEAVEAGQVSAQRLAHFHHLAEQAEQFTQPGKHKRG